MSEEAEKLIAEWRAFNAAQFEKIVAQLKKDAVGDILAKICPTYETDVVVAPSPTPAAETAVASDGKISQANLERLLRSRRAGSTAVAPAKVPYGALGSDAESEAGTIGGIVTDIVE